MSAELRRELTKHSGDYVLVGSERERFLGACKRPLELMVYYCLGRYGLRVSEFMHMSWNWLDAQEGDIRIPAQTPCDCRKCVTKYNGIWQPKTKAGIRTIPARDIDEDGWHIMLDFFADGNRIPKHESTIFRVIKTVAKRAGITHDVYPHSLRATASMSLSTIPGMTASILMSIMGWESLETANNYVKASAVETKRILRASKAGVKT